MVTKKLKEEVEAFPGIALRDYFAINALQALIQAKPHYSSGETVSVAYSYADMMLHERVHGNY